MEFESFQYFELLSLVAAVVYYRGLKRFRIWLFVPLLVLINGFEIVGVNYKGPNYFIYNVLILVKTPLCLLLYQRMLGLTGRRLTWFRLIGAGCLLFLLLDYSYLEGSVEFDTYSFILTESLNIFFSCLILLSLFMREDADVPLLTESYFWIASGNMLFSLAILVVLGLLKYIQLYAINVGGKSLYRVFVPPATIVLYSAYTYAFYLCRQRIPRR